MRDLISRAAAPSIFGRTMCRPARSNFAGMKYGCSPNSGARMPRPIGGSGSKRAWPHNLGLVIAKAIQGQLAAGVSPLEIVRQAALFGARNRDGWGTGMTILTAIGNSLAILPEQETYLALFHGVRRVAIDCDGEAPARKRSSLSSRPSPATLKRWLRRWVSVRHREAAERTVLTAIAIGARSAVLADLLIAAETDRVFADGGHSLDFINKSFECLDLIGWQHAADLLPSVIGQMVAARGADEFDGMARADRSRGALRKCVG